MKRIVSISLAAGLLACALPLISGWSLSRQSQSPGGLLGSPAARQQRLQHELQQQQQVKTFTGKISKSGQKLILEDESMKTSYQLDDQKKAQAYQGKRVVVTGTLDAENNVIHVQAIEEAV
jgi:Protein of unknown function (DUF5818)